MAIVCLITWCQTLIFWPQCHFRGWRALQTAGREKALVTDKGLRSIKDVR